MTKDDGTSYRGKVRIGAGARECLPWTRTGQNYLVSNELEYHLEENYCRQPKFADTEPFCFIYKVKGRSQCGIPPCSKRFIHV
jgi:hypothetical protein